MANLTKLPLHAEDGLIRVVVETPRGANLKIAYNPELECFEMSRELIIGLSYPYDWGFIPSTCGDDGDPLDALVMHDAPTAPGLVLSCQIVGALKVMQESKGKRLRNDRFIAVPDCAPRAQAVQDASKLPQDVRSQLEEFFIAAVKLQEKKLEFLGWAGPDEAMALVEAGAKKIDDSHPLPLWERAARRVRSTPLARRVRGNTPKS